jgi:hypothetical protein
MVEVERACGVALRLADAPLITSVATLVSEHLTQRRVIDLQRRAACGCR